MKINPNIFKAYDVRGKVPAEVNHEIAECIGGAAAVFISKKQKKKYPLFLVCRDVRTSSPELKDSVVKGIVEQGMDVMDAGIGTTPFFYFLMQSGYADGGVMITASHNPPEYNGFKIRGKGGRAISMGTGLEDVRRLAAKKIKPSKKRGNIVPAPEDLKDKYIKSIAKGVSIEKVSAVIDAAGGSTCFFLPEALGMFPDFKYKPLFFEPDGSFSRHSPNPLQEESQKEIKKALREGKYRFGAIFDGDGDRVIFLDEKGEVIGSDYVAALLAEREMQKNPGSSFVFTVNSSKGVREALAAKGAKIKLSRVGYVNMQDAMKRAGAVLGAELSGHFYFKDFGCDDSAILALLRFAELVSHADKPLSRLVEPYKTYVSSGEINFSVADKKGVLAGIKKRYGKGRLAFLDGITAEFPEWWFNVRPSNTEPLIRLVLEAKNRELYEEKLSEIKEIVG